MGRKRHYVKVTLKGSVVESHRSLPLLLRGDQTSLPELLRLIEAAGRHPRVEALMLSLKGPRLGWSALQELQRSLDRFHETGKRSAAYLEQGDNKSYYLACSAQRLCIPPSATLELVGLSVELLFLKNLLDFLGIQPQLLHVGRFKSAVEMFTRRQMSKAQRAMLDSLTGDLQRQLIEGVARGRGVEAAQVRRWIAEGPCPAREALARGMVDDLLYEDQVESLLESEKPPLRQLAAVKLKAREGVLRRWLTFYRPQIACLLVEGMITLGASSRRPGGRTTTGAESLVTLLRRARGRRRVRAVVLRVNSPGGSALASDLLWREVFRTREKKPVVVSFGDVAASGGYYLALAGSCIFGMPGGLTGSIGVIHGKFNLGRLLSKAGIAVDRLSQGRHAGWTSPLRPFSQEQLQLVEKQMLEFYEQLFLAKVAQGRGKSLEQVRPLAEGRVWTGAQALEKGLLDHQGGLLDAIDQARRAAGLTRTEHFRIVEYAPRLGLRDLLSPPDPRPGAGDRVLALMPEPIDIR